MNTLKREVFLVRLLSELISRYPDWPIEDHYKIEWEGQPKYYWPEADIVISLPGRQFIIEYDEDNDPGRSLTKYWPILDESGHISLTIIEVWKKGPAIGQGYATLAKWMGERLMKFYPGCIFEFIERKDESAEVITDRIARIVLGKSSS